MLDTRCVYYIHTPPGKRLKILPKLMETFDLMYALLAEQGPAKRPGIIAPKAFAKCEADWPDFEW